MICKPIESLFNVMMPFPFSDKSLTIRKQKDFEQNNFDLYEKMQRQPTTFPRQQVQEFPRLIGLFSSQNRKKKCKIDLFRQNSCKRQSCQQSHPFIFYNIGVSPSPPSKQGKFSRKRENDFYKRALLKRQFLRRKTSCLLYNYYIRIIKMANEGNQDWNQLIDLQSYSYDGFYNKNQFLIDEAEHFEIQLNPDPAPYIHVDYMLDTRMETNQTRQTSNHRRDEEDYFYFDSENQGSKLREETLNDDESSLERKKRESPESLKMNKKIKKDKKGKKNQYDKNIFANITTVIIKKMLSQPAESQLQYYCQQKEVDLQAFRSYFTSIQRSKQRLGTTQLSSFYESQERSSDFKAVFSMFMARFLREQYLLYVVREGKMQEKQKYLRCATKMMYIPRLRKEEYGIISNLMNKV